MLDVLVYFHIPRTAGTYFNHAVGDFLADGWLHHYNYTENSSLVQLQNFEIPAIKFRTEEQDTQIKILSGHSIDSQSHNWLKTPKNPLYYSIVRDPVERLLSSFHYKRQKTLLLQDNSTFSNMMPQLSPEARHLQKTHNSYNTLFEYCIDSNAEKNLQVKWLLKSFIEFNYWSDTFEEINQTYIPDNSLFSDNQKTVPDWMYQHLDIDKQLIDNYIDKMWWISDFNNLEEDTRFICNRFDIMYNDVKPSKQNSTKKVDPMWSIEEVKNQPDYQQLVDWLELDYYLYDKVKLLKRPK